MIPLINPPILTRVGSMEERNPGWLGKEEEEAQLAALESCFSVGVL